jgi:hypothetical protein
MKKYLPVSLLALLTVNAFAQTAVNFTSTDCAGNTHTLFSELDAGKVAVMVWVMPCSACADGAAAAHAAVQNIEASNPGKVVYYVIDDVGDNSCSLLTNWTNGNVASGLTIFQNTDGAISMSDYGTSGMPKVVVAGGYQHHVYFNKNNGLANDATGIEAAINTALTDVVSVQQPASTGHARWVWNGVDQNGTLYFNVPVSGTLSHAVYNLLGQPVSRTQKVNVGNNQYAVDVAIPELSSGVYFLQVNLNGNVSTYRLSVR